MWLEHDPEMVFMVFGGGVVLLSVVALTALIARWFGPVCVG